MRRGNSSSFPQIKDQVSFEICIGFFLLIAQLHVTHGLGAGRHVDAVPHLEADRRLQQPVGFLDGTALGQPFVGADLILYPLPERRLALAVGVVDEAGDAVRIERAIG